MVDSDFDWVVCVSFFLVVEREWTWCVYIIRCLFPFVEKMVDFDFGWVVCLSFFQVVEREWTWYLTIVDFLP